MMKAKIRNNYDADACKRRLANAKSPEDVAAEIAAYFGDVMKSEVEISEDELKATIGEMVKQLFDAEMAEKITEGIAKRVKSIEDSIKGETKKEIAPKVVNSILASMLRSGNREDAVRNAERVAVENGITGMTFGEIVDYAIADKWGDDNELFAALNNQPFTKFFYTVQELVSAGVISEDVAAHGWSKASNADKKKQNLTVTGKTINTQYIYKSQGIDQEDLDNAEQVGEMTALVTWVTNELKRQIVNTIVAVMVGNTSTEITCIEPLTKDTDNDAFVTSVTTASKTAVTMTEARSICDAVKNPYGKAKWAVMTTSQLAKLAEFKYAEGGTTSYRSKEEVAGNLGVDKIYVCDNATTFICFLPDGYWLKTKKTINVVYPTWERNRQNYQSELNIGGAIHDLKSVAIAK